MIKVIKDGLITFAKDNAMLALYIENGWQVVSEKKQPIVQVEIELTKKQLQEKLDELQVEYKPIENKATLMDKLKEASPTNNFDDGLLKG